MKKKILLLGIFMIFLLTGCGGGTREVKSVSDFETVSKNNGFTVVNNKDSYGEVSYIKEAVKATTSDIVIEMIVYDNADDAEKVLEEHIKSFNLLKSTGATEKRQTGDNYHKYFLISNNYYMVSSRIDNTLIFCKTLVTNKESVDKVLDELGY